MTRLATIETAGEQPDVIACRLCDAAATRCFDMQFMGKHNVRFYRCGGCGSLQTEAPYWLDEAYSNSNLAMLDTGAAQRNINNLAAVYAWVRLARLKTVVDIGGGDGLLCRLLRDYGVDARLEDRYAKNSYAQGFAADQHNAPVLYTAFEVLEHYANPRQDLSALFDSKPESIIITTDIYDDQGTGWWYLTPDSGQHVFFYSRRALQIIGDRYGYSVRFIGNYTVMTKDNGVGPLKMMAARFALGRIGTRLLRSLMMLLPARGVARDYERIASRG